VEKVLGVKFIFELGEMSLYGEKGIVLGHVIFKDGIEIDKAKVDLIVNYSIHILLV